MKGGAATELLLIRHAPAMNDGRLCGRTDVPADCSDTARIRALRALLGPPDRVISSPALRCRQTSAAIWPENTAPENVDAFWEQDFGAWDGLPFTELPDLGHLSSEALAAHRPPQGESFEDLCARVAPALSAAASGGRVAIVAHAGVVRAGIARAIGAAGPALRFDVSPLSVTCLRVTREGEWSVAMVNGGAG